ncbi:hypothetical protein AB1Y20_006014 [Prymnesium parvum]|uniref:EGF-like domain-containing protein n=1 Tax=Prymnesium parvum TaxID=97485 RepID=A0AB34J3C8_PRYPA
MALLLPVALAANPCVGPNVASCGTWGYCDASVRRCICAPGWSGASCSEPHFGGCRLHAAGEMACATFRGLMSCLCRQQCERKFGGVMRRHASLCWAWADTSAGREAARRAVVNTSDFPDSIDNVVFHTPSWPPQGRCARNPAAKVCGALTRSLRRATHMLGGTPMPNRHCPLACSFRGTCLLPSSERSAEAKERYPLASVASGGNAVCICHEGYSGAGCETEDPSFCFNNCSGKGRCVGRFCLCDRTWQGVDCSLSYPTGHPTLPALSDGGAAIRRKYAPTYIYPLPTDFSLEAVYQRDMLRRGQYYANLVYLEQLLARKDAVVADPNEAALFFVPVMAMQMAGNLWHPYEFLKETVELLRHNYPYWNRSAGTDHIFFLTTDRGGCWKPWALQHSLIVSYLGFPASEAYFGFEERLRWPRRGPQTRNNAYSVRKGAESLELDCYVPSKDVVVPVDALLGSAEEKKLPPPGKPFVCNTARSTLMFMGGAMSNMGRIEYSQGVRQAIKQFHSNEKGFVLGGKFTLDMLRDSRFCLCPSGWGWGWRLSLAVVTQCVPVIIQPNVSQPFEDLIPYKDFSVRLDKDQIPKLPQILKSVTDESVCKMQQALAKYWRAFLWQQPFGAQHPSAYDLMQIQLCRRARRLSSRYRSMNIHTHTVLFRHGVSCADSLAAAGIRFD